jgi:hypothetical protein
MSASPDETNRMKAETYEALAAVNRSFEQLIIALYRLQKSVTIGEDYAYNYEIIFSDMWARINTNALAKITARELEDKNHFRLMRASLERKRGKAS